MKLKHTFSLGSALLLAVGCAHENHQAKYDESISPYAADGTSRYANQQNNIHLNAGGTTDNSAMTAGTLQKEAAKAPSVSDNTLVTQVHEALERNAEIAPIVPNIQISANNGTVTLSGTVQSEAQKRQIESICLNASGNSLVVLDNQLNAPAENAPAATGTETGAVNNGDQKANSDSGGATGQASQPGESGSLSATGSANNMNEATNSQTLAPTSNGGDNSVNRVYSTTDTNNIQNNPGQGEQNQNTNSNNQMP